MNNTTINLSTLTAKTVLASTFSQVAYLSSEQLKSYKPPEGFVAIKDVTNAVTGFSAVTFINKTTGEGGLPAQDTNLVQSIAQHHPLSRRKRTRRAQPGPHPTCQFDMALA